MLAQSETKRVSGTQFDQNNASIKDLADRALQLRKENEAREAKQKYDVKMLEVKQKQALEDEAKRRFALKQENAEAKREAQRKENARIEAERMAERARQAMIQKQALADLLKQKEPEVHAKIKEDAKKEYQEELRAKAQADDPKFFESLNQFSRIMTVNKGGIIIETIRELLMAPDPKGRDMLKKCLSSMFHPDQGRIRKDGELLAKINNEFTELETK